MGVLPVSKKEGKRKCSFVGRLSEQKASTYYYNASPCLTDCSMFILSVLSPLTRISAVRFSLNAPMENTEVCDENIMRQDV